MPLKSLTINGFKSFADKTTIEFTTGITGIVGPNGSGKSNITEAIRWVMGEQSAKSLRGSHMPDIIFAGSALRPALNRAEVKLVFDNHDHALKTAQDVVEISRRLFRDGTSDFLLNHHNCRLRDISNLFLDSGLGKEAFAIISQGRVEQVFNSKPEDRRTIIEEAAGVFKFKQQKKQAEAELAVTNENLNRIADIVSELGGRVEPLRKQASLARDYQQQKAKYDGLNQQILALELADLQQQHDQHVEHQNELHEISERIDQQTAEVSEQLKSTRRESDQIDQTIEQRQNDLVKLTREQETLNGQISLSKERKSYHQANESALTQQLTENETAIGQQQEVLAATEAKLAQIQAENQQLAKQLANLEAQQGENPEDLAKQVNDLRADYIEQLQRQATVRNELVFGQENLNKLTAQQGQAEEQLTKLQMQQQAIQTKVHELQSIAHQRADELQVQQNQLHANDQQAAEWRQKITDQEQDWYQELERFQQQKARYQSLKELTEDHSGFYQGVRAVLNAKPALPGLIGAVADLLKVPAKLQFAIEQVLGSQLQQIVSEDTQSAEQAINYLKTKRLGRATFLPLTTIRPYHLDRQVLQTAQQAPGFVGVASELIEFEPRVKNVIDHLLGNILIMDQLPQATQFAKQIHYQTRIVTLDGDILTPGGAMTGGKTKQQHQSLLSRQQELTQLQVTIKKQQVSLNTMQAAITEGKEATKQLSSQRVQLEKTVQAAADNANQAKQDVAAQTQNLQRLERQLQAEQLEQTRHQSEVADLQKQLQQKTQEQQSLSKHIDQQKASIAALQERLTHFTTQRDLLTGQVSELKTKVAVAQASLTNAMDQKKRQQRELETLQAQQANLQTTLKKLEADQQSTQLDEHQVTAQLERLSTQLAELTATMATLKEKRQALSQKIEELEPQTQRQYQLQKQTAKEQEQVAVALNSLKSEMASRLTALREDYQLTFEAAYQNLPTDHPSLESLQSALKLVRMALRDIGSVNLDAIAEFDEVNERYEFLSKQQDDLITARTELLKTMSKMDQEVSQRFATTFKAVDQAFTQIFPKMFGGGQAKLELTDPDNWLTTGIEINAQPPGKKLQSLSLLSGGERALTAITLLFAILKVKPAPFSILDEVEASLDDANVDRFANYLRHYEDQTQFIVITHRKGTMMQVDRLYGVTMQESGVSKMISVSLTDVDQEKIVSGQ